MSLEEKIGQLNQLNGLFFQDDVESVLTGPGQQLGLTEEDIRLTGSILGTAGAKPLMEIQKSYMETQPHHIPMLFMMDVIHGMRTIFPLPLGLGATFDPELAEKCAAVAAKEAAVAGLHATFSPMSDLVRDARWGRVMESTGEDPYLNSLFTAAQVRGFQGESRAKGQPYEPYKICACVKHFAGYGGAEAGREYNTVELCEHTFREFYLKAYQAGIDAGVDMVMTSFNTINGIPATTNQPLMRDILRGEMGFRGVLISDYSAILETIAHGYSEDGAHAAENGLRAGVDIDMMTGLYSNYLAKLIQDGTLEESLLDECVMRVLELKNNLGLFEHPYKDADPEKESEFLLCPEHRALARETAAKSFVLLKNDGVLPLDLNQKIAFIGPYTDRKQIISSWALTGEATDSCTIREAASEVFNPERTTYLPGSPVLDPSYILVGFREDDNTSSDITPQQQKEMLLEAVEAAKAADLVIMPLGEHYLQSGEATSRAMIDIPDVQMELFREVTKVNDNVVVVLFNGRPLDLREVSQKARAILDVWMPGTEGGHAIIDVLTGKVNPSGKLTMSFPYCVGQVPVYYNCNSTGRPELPNQVLRFKSRYLDIPNAPLYPFGYGLSYTTFALSPVRLEAEGAEAHSLTADGKLQAKVTLQNTGTTAGTEVVQLYLQDVSASVVRPVKELKGFRKVSLEPGESCEVCFDIDESMLRFLRADGTVGSEPGVFRVWVANDSASGEAAEFTLV